MSMQVPRLALSYASCLGDSMDMCPREARFELRLPCRDLPSSNLTPLGHLQLILEPAWPISKWRFRRSAGKILGFGGCEATSETEGQTLVTPGKVRGSAVSESGFKEGNQSKLRPCVLAPGTWQKQSSRGAVAGDIHETEGGESRDI